MNKYIVPIIVLTFILFATIWRLRNNSSHPNSYEINDVNYVQQPDAITCGPTSGVMLLEKYGKIVSLEDVKNHAKTQWFHHNNEPVGMTSPELLNYAIKKLGVDSELKNGKIDDIKYYVSQKRPPIVLLRSSRNTWHYVLVIGYTEEKIIIADPAIGAKSEIKTNDFLGAWDFLTDMSGRPASSTCLVCSGTGRWVSVQFGPLSICEICGGSGLQPDYLGLLLKAADIYPRTLIVPKFAFDR